MPCNEENGKKIHRSSSLHGKGIWGLSCVCMVGKEDQTERKVAYCLYLSWSALGILVRSELGLDLKRWLYCLVSGLLWNALCPSPGGEEMLRTSHVTWRSVFLDVSPFFLPAKINPVPTELERGAVIKGSNDVTDLWWLIRNRSSREFCLFL